MMCQHQEANNSYNASAAGTLLNLVLALVTMGCFLYALLQIHDHVCSAHFALEQKTWQPVHQASYPVTGQGAWGSSSGVAKIFTLGS